MNIFFLGGKDIHTLSAIKILYKYKHNKLPQYFDKLLDKPIPQHRYETRHAGSRPHSCPNTITASQSPKYVIPKIIDSLPESLISKIESHTIKAFSFQAKSYLLQNYNELCTVERCYICNRT